MVNICQAVEQSVGFNVVFQLQEVKLSADGPT